MATEGNRNKRLAASTQHLTYTAEPHTRPRVRRRNDNSTTTARRAGEYILLQSLAVIVAVAGLVFFVTLVPLWLRLKISGSPSLGLVVYVGIAWLLVGLATSSIIEMTSGDSPLDSLLQRRSGLFLVFVGLCAMTFITLLVSGFVFES